MILAALFILVKTWMQPRCLSKDYKLVYSHNGITEPQKEMSYQDIGEKTCINLLHCGVKEVNLKIGCMISTI